MNEDIAIILAARRLFSASDPIREAVNHRRIMSGEWDGGTWLSVYIALAKLEAHDAETNVLAHQDKAA